MSHVDTMQVNDIGTIIRLTIEDGGTAVDVSSASTKQVLLEKPDGTLLTKTASFTTDGTDGQIEYTTTGGDIDSPGRWKVQASVEMTAGSWKSTVEFITVLENLG